MKTNFLRAILFLLTALIYQSCGNENSNTDKSDQDTAKAVQPATGPAMKIKAFNDVNNLVTVLSENGIGTLKPWQNPMDQGYGSLTDYYPIGTAKVEYGLMNNVAYYLEGMAKNMLPSLNINNPDEKKQ
jgi:hypothetical protein